MTDLSENIENLNRDVKEAEKSVLSAIVDMGRDLHTVIPSHSATGSAILNSEGEGGSNSCCERLLSKLDSIRVDLLTATGKLDQLDNLSHLSKLDNLSKLNDLAGEEKNKGSSWKELITGQGGLKESFESFKDAISELADRLLTFGDMAKIADKAVDIGQMANMTGTSVHDVQQAIYMGNRFGANENETMLFYKNIAKLNMGIKTNNMSDVGNQDILQYLNKLDHGVLAPKNARIGKDYTFVERLEAIRNALQQMSDSNDEKIRALALVYKNKLSHGDKHIFSMLDIPDENSKDVNGQMVWGYQAIKQQSAKSANIATNEKTQATNEKTSDENAWTNNSNDANNYKATAVAGPVAQTKAKLQRDFIESNEDLVANTKAAIAIANEVNDKISLALTAFTAIAGFIGIVVSIGKGIGNVVKGLRKLKGLSGINDKGGGGKGGGLGEELSESLDSPVKDEVKEFAEKEIGEAGKKVNKSGFLKRAWAGSKNIVKKYGTKFGVKLGERIAREMVAKAAVGTALAETGPGDVVVEGGWLAYDFLSAGFDALKDDDNEKSKPLPKKNAAKIILPQKTLPSSLNFPTTGRSPADWQQMGNQMPVTAQSMMKAMQVQNLQQTFNANNNQQYHVNIVVQPSTADPMQIAQQIHHKFTQNVSHLASPQIQKTNM